MKRSLKNALLAGLAGLAFAWAAPAASQQKAADPPAATAPPALAVPRTENIVILIRNALLALNAANQTDNYTVLRDMAAPSFRNGNSTGRLGRIFQPLRDQGIDLTPVAILPPQLSEAPTIDANNVLHLAGFFQTQPLQLNFQIKFQPVNGHWLLYEMSVSRSAAVPVAPAATAAEPAPTSGKAPPKKK